MTPAASVPVSRLHRFSVSEYHKLCRAEALPRNLELLQGYLVEKMTVSPEHARIVTLLRKLLEERLQGQWLIREEKPLTAADSEPEPDIAVVAGSADDYRHSHPEKALFVIEVALSSLAPDLDKAAIYALMSVPEYWIIDLARQETIVHRNPAGDSYLDKSVHAAQSPIALPLPQAGQLILSELL